MYRNDVTPQKRSLIHEIETAHVEFNDSPEIKDATDSVVNECPILGCSLKLKLKSSIKRHVQQFHGELRSNGLYGILKYICQQCDRRCMSKNNLKQHYHQQHKGIQPTYETDWDDVEPLQYK